MSWNLSEKLPLVIRSSSVSIVRTSGTSFKPRKCASLKSSLKITAFGLITNFPNAVRRLSLLFSQLASTKIKDTKPFEACNSKLRTSSVTTRVASARTTGPGSKARGSPTRKFSCKFAADIKYHDNIPLQ